MANARHLIPEPKELHFTTGRFVLPPELYIVLQAHPATRQTFPAERFRLDAEPLTGCRMHMVAGSSTKPEQEIRLEHDAELGSDLAPEIRSQAYRLTIAPEGIVIQAFAAAGTFYGLQTLLQIVREAAFSDISLAPASGSRGARNQKSKIKNQKSHSLPCLTIFDHPDFSRRGFYHDTARGKVPKGETLLQLIDELGHLKYNEFQLYVENNFQYRKHPDFYDDTDPLTGEELLLLDAACRVRHIDFVPSLTSLGHFEKILSRPAYRHLAEAQPEQLKAIGAPCWVDSAWSLCVTDPAAKRLLRDLYGEFAPHFSSTQFNICCDEAYDLGRVRSKALAEKIGTGQMYVDWICYCEELARSQGKSIQMWGDIILNHPELIGQLPEGVTLLEWGYEHDHKFEEHCQTFAERLRGTEVKGQKGKIKNGRGFAEGRSFYVAPGTSSWLTLSSRTKNALGNIHNAAKAGLKYGARGLLLTDWGDQGHQQLLAVSLAAVAYGAAASWNLAATPNPADSARALQITNQKSKIKNLLHAISRHLFQDPTATFASLAYDLGLTYERLGWQRFNASLDHFLFREKWDCANYVNRASTEALRATMAATKELMGPFEFTPLLHPDGELLREEFLFTCREINHTCQRTLLRKQWLAADPARRNAEDLKLRAAAPKPLPRDYATRMRELHGDALALKRQFARLWLARNKKSRMEDVLAEFDRLAKEYTKFGRRR